MSESTEEKFKEFNRVFSERIAALEAEVKELREKVNQMWPSSFEPAPSSGSRHPEDAPVGGVGMPESMRETDPERLARLRAAEQQRLMDEFWANVRKNVTAPTVQQAFDKFVAEELPKYDALMKNLAGSEKAEAQATGAVTFRHDDLVLARDNQSRVLGIYLVHKHDGHPIWFTDHFDDDCSSSKEPDLTILMVLDLEQMSVDAAQRGEGE